MTKELDLVFKSISDKFSNVMTEILGVKENIVSSAPTELVNLKGTNHILDFVYKTKEGILINIEFQSNAPTNDDYARFILYKVALFRQNNMEVRTYIICASTVKNKPPIKFDEELCFNPTIISLKDFNSTEIINTIKNKQSNNEKLSLEDLINLLLTPLMVEKEDNEKQMIETAELFSKITHKQTHISHENLEDIGDMMGLLLRKYVKDCKKQKKFLGEILMTTDGFKKLMEEYEEKGIEIGEERGIEKGINKLKTAKKLLSENFTIKEIMEKTGLSKEDLEIIK